MSGIKTKKSVFETWVVALQKYGNDPKTAIKNIDAFMRSNFPKRKTNWAKWANLVRQRYNRGAFLKGTPIPRKPLAVFITPNKA